MMRIVDSTGRLFSKNDLRDFLNARKQALFEEIASLDEDPCLITSLEDLSDQFVDNYTLSAPRIDESERRIDFEDLQIDLRTRAYYHLYDPDRPVYGDGTRYTVLVPFTGNPELFERRPFTATGVMPPRAVVRGNELAFAYELLPEEDDLLEEKLNRDLASLKAYLGGIAHDLDAFNSSIREFARPRIRARHAKLLRARQRAENLGFPVVRRVTDLAPQPPAVSTDPEPPQPSSGVPEFRAAKDYKLVYLGDQEFSLTSTQAEVVEILREAYLQTGIPELGQDYIRERLGWKETRVRDVFKRSRAWGKLISSGKTPGSVRLIL